MGISFGAKKVRLVEEDCASYDLDRELDIHGELARETSGNEFYLDL